ncbi:MAG: hypothetical protein GY835_28425 [bacterium]|nr:hypothetical protein [bacterium]
MGKKIIWVLIKIGAVALYLLCMLFNAAELERGRVTLFLEIFLSLGLDYNKSQTLAIFINSYTVLAVVLWIIVRSVAKPKKSKIIDNRCQGCGMIEPQHKEWCPTGDKSTVD